MKISGNSFFQSGFILMAIFLSWNVQAQETRINPHLLNLENEDDIGNENGYTYSDSTYDVHFYHIDLEIEIDFPYLEGSVSYEMSSVVDGLNSLILDLDDAFTVDSVSAPATSFSFSDKLLTIEFGQTFDTGDPIAFSVYYKGEPDLAGGYKGLRYETHDGGEPIIASLSTPYLAHTWWPCKDGTSDKADSTFIDITIRDTMVNAQPVVAVSNGLLSNVETVGNKTTYEWRHYYPAVPYYIMVAISNFTHFQEIYNEGSYSFPLDYYVFESHLANAQEGVSDVPDMMDCFIELFGDYPFKDEKYAMTQLGYYGGIENQTNSIINSMDVGWINVTVHELAHQWFADMITCDGWNHAWLNEGFASYAEALYRECDQGFDAYKSYASSFEYYNGGTLYLEDISNPFNSVFVSIIYDKGAYVLHMLRGVLGDDKFFETIYTYATSPEHKYRHATTEEFQAICESVGGVDLDYFFDQWIYDEYYPRYKYNYEQNLSSGNLWLFLQQEQWSSGWRETFTMPVQVGIEFLDGSDTLVTVFNDSSVQSYFFDFEQEVVDVRIDPNDWILKEVEYDPGFSVATDDFSPGGLGVKVIPNPNTGVFEIHFSRELTGGELLLKIFDTNGRLIQERLVFSSEVSGNKLQVEGLSSGLYFLNVESESFRQQLKVLVVE